MCLINIAAKYRTRPPPPQLPLQQLQPKNESSSPNEQTSAASTDLNPQPITGIGKGPPTIPCDNCGGLQVISWKGGGYNMT